MIDLEPTHYNCCHAPKDLGHMDGCPNSEWRNGPDPLDETTDVRKEEKEADERSNHGGS